ncbi:hypothetical protein D3C80_1482820 [compost metagenome]
MGRDNDRLVLATGIQNDLLLDSNQFGVTDFHPQITARNHHAVTGADQCIQTLVVGHSLSAFDFGDDPG